MAKRKASEDGHSAGAESIPEDEGCEVLRSAPDPVIPTYFILLSAFAGVAKIGPFPVSVT
jgi:hypothetical protein